MQKNEDLSKKRAEAARRRWNKGNGNAEQNPAPADPTEPVVESSDMQSDASAMQMHSNDMQSDAGKKKKAMVLAGGLAQIELLRQLKDRGITTVLCDGNANALAHG